MTFFPGVKVVDNRDLSQKVGSPKWNEGFPYMRKWIFLVRAPPIKPIFNQARTNFLRALFEAKREIGRPVITKPYSFP